MICQNIHYVNTVIETIIKFDIKNDQFLREINLTEMYEHYKLQYPFNNNKISNYIGLKTISNEKFDETEFLKVVRDVLR